MPDQTIAQAAAELHTAVAALKEFIEREFPTRREVERRFVTRADRKRSLVIILVAVLVSSFLSFCISVTTISTCFLGPSLDHPGVCKAIPGYKESVDNNKEIIKEFRELQERSTRNEKRIDRLERKAG